MIDVDICLYASHLPLDAHIEVGNNIALLKEFISSFGMKEGDYSIENFGKYYDNFIGFGLRFNKNVFLKKFISHYINKIGLIDELYNFGNIEHIQSICFVSGGGASTLLEANLKGFDMFLTGEATHSEIIEAKDLSQTICLGGHYETEIFGVRLLSNYIKHKYDNIETIFLDEKY